MAISQREALWTLCFEDELSSAREFLSISDIKVIEEFCEGALVGMASLVPVMREDGERGAYVFGVCTHPSHRGKGIFKGIMARCEQTALADGCSFICLIPVSQRVALSYRKMGYSLRVSLCDGHAKDSASIYPHCEDFRRYAASDSSELLSEPYGLLKPLSASFGSLECRFAEPMGER